MLLLLNNVITIQKCATSQKAQNALKMAFPHDSVTKLGQSTRKLEKSLRTKRAQKVKKMHFWVKSNRLRAFDATSSSRYSTSY
jgi:hypothetical protein